MVWDPALVAASVRFPVLVVTGGISEPGWVAGFAGSASDPQGIHLRYGHPWSAAELQVSSSPGDSFDDLVELVHRSFGGAWWAMTNRPPAPPPALPAGAPPREISITGHIDNEPDPELERAWKAQDRAIRKAVKAADKHEIVVSLDGSAADAYMVETPGLWAIGVHDKGKTPMTAVLIGRAVRIDALQLGWTTDLPALYGDRPTL